MITNDELDHLEALANAATSGPWTTGPCNAAGEVWVYAHRRPLCEPLQSLMRRLKGRLLLLFRIRHDSNADCVLHETSEEREKRFWQQKAADAAFIVASRNTMPRLIRALRLQQTPEVQNAQS